MENVFCSSFQHVEAYFNSLTDQMQIGQANLLICWLVVLGFRVL